MPLAVARAPVSTFTTHPEATPPEQLPRHAQARSKQATPRHATPDGVRSAKQLSSTKATFPRLQSQRHEDAQPRETFGPSTRVRPVWMAVSPWSDFFLKGGSAARAAHGLEGLGRADGRAGAEDLEAIDALDGHGGREARQVVTEDDDEVG